MNRRFSKGLTFTIAYTYAEAIDEVVTSVAFAVATQPNGAQNPNDRAADRSRSDFDARQRWVSSFLWELPFQSRKGVAGWILGGWEFGGITTLQDGNPGMRWRSGRDNSLTAIGFDRPNLIGDPLLDPGRPRGQLVDGYFNTDAFEQNAKGTFGNSPRNLLEGPGQINFDFSLSKKFPVKEGHTLDFRVDSFNGFNRPGLGDPRTTERAGSFGRISGSGAGRIFQLSLKYSF